jgi:hypothetical protein
MPSDGLAGTQPHGRGLRVQVGPRGDPETRENVGPRTRTCVTLRHQSRLLGACAETGLCVDRHPWLAAKTLELIRVADGRRVFAHSATGSHLTETFRSVAGTAGAVLKGTEQHRRAGRIG